nr:PepSY domain-containing protein [uncultured Pseudomonas sp.]
MSNRLVHLWSGVLLALPMFIVGVTAIFIAHEKSLGTKEMPISWLSMAADKELELRAVTQTADGRLWLGSQQGLFVQQADGLPLRRADFEVRQLLSEGDSLWVASKMGLYQLQGDDVALRLDGDVHGISRLADGQLMASVKDMGAMQSRDGLSWNAWAGNEALLAAQGEVVKPYTVGKLVMDMHTGKAFFGKSGEWVWIDVLGFTLALLGLTGVWVWWQSRRRAAI